MRWALAALAVLAGCGGAVSASTPPPGDAGAGDGDAGEVPAQVCSCEAPYTCGSVDLQGLTASPGACGLDCRVEAFAPACNAHHPIAYRCPASAELRAMQASGALVLSYDCELRADALGEMLFCCGF